MDEQPSPPSIVSSPRLTALLPGSGGTLERSVHDFSVEEILPYAPSGQGEHLFIEIEKLDLTSFEAAARLADAVGLGGKGSNLSREIGIAGLKDKSSRARQWISIPWRSDRDLPDVSSALGPGLSVHTMMRNETKLRRGHTRANRFSIVIRNVPEEGFLRATAVLEALRKTGVPNFFGPQRFGFGGTNVAHALRCVRGESRPPSDRRKRDLLLSAVQSHVFNRAVEIRMERGFFATALLGDVMKKHDTGGLFDVIDPAAEQSRVDALAISPTAWLPGRRARSASGVPQEIEEQAVTELALRESEVDGLGDGTRRPTRYPLAQDAKVSPEGVDAYRLDVTLPSGAYATVLLDELVKPDGGPLTRRRTED